jgi:hypothetical protein
MKDFVTQVQTSGTADLAGTNLDICHVTAIDKIKETMAVALTNRTTASAAKKRKIIEAVEETISSDEEDDRADNVKRVKRALDPNKTTPQEAMEIVDKVLTRTNKSSRNTRPDHKRPNRGIGNSKDPFVLDNGTELQEESRSKGISDHWNDARQTYGLSLDVPKSKKVGQQTQIKSSSIDQDAKKAFASISSNTFTL